MGRTERAMAGLGAESNMDLCNTVALVTGGAQRVGRAISLELAQAGCDVAIHYGQSRAQAEALVAEVQRLGRKAVAVPGELLDETAWRSIVAETVDRLGRLDVLINNASRFLAGGADNLEDFDAASWEEMLRVNLLAPMGLCQAAAVHLRAGGQGRIVNLLDIAVDRPFRDHFSYVASKAALASMTKALARTLAPEVCVCGVAPGVAVFPESYGPALKQSILDKVPLGRAGNPEGIALMVRFLCESGDYITGEIIRVDGGRHLE